MSSVKELIPFLTLNVCIMQADTKKSTSYLPRYITYRIRKIINVTFIKLYIILTTLSIVIIDVVVSIIFNMLRKLNNLYEINRKFITTISKTVMYIISAKYILVCLLIK